MLKFEKEVNLHTFRGSYQASIPTANYLRWYFTVLESVIILKNAFEYRYSGLYDTSLSCQSEKYEYLLQF